MIMRPYPKTMCGQLPPAAQREPYCPVCSALQDVPQDDDDAWLRAVDSILDRVGRVQKIHRQYRQKVKR